MENVSAFDAGLTRAQVESIAAAGQIDQALLGGPDFLAAWPPDRRPSREQLQARWIARPEPAQNEHHSVPAFPTPIRACGSHS
jgi:hypothetical protein